MVAAIENLTAPFTKQTDLAAVYGCELTFRYFDGSQQVCGLEAVFTVCYRDDPNPFICCANHLAEAVELKIRDMLSSIFDPGRVLVSFLSEFVRK